MQDQLTKYSVVTALKVLLRGLYSSVRLILPISFFIGGFIWDAITIGHRVAWSDLAIFGGYMIAAGLILHQLATPAFWWQHFPKLITRWGWLEKKLSSWPMEDWPYWILQFLFGSMLSALFILYFKSSSNSFAWGLTLFLGVLLIANEFLEGEYRRFTLCWSLFGLCNILFLNFALPYILGSVNALWFYLSTCLGALACHLLYYHAPKHIGSIWPVWLIAGMLMFGYRVDMIPPVPLVKEAIVIAYDIEKTPEGYWMTLEKAPWWKFWRVDSDHFYVAPGQQMVCFSSVFAPSGLRTKLIHDWQKNMKGKWVSVSSPSFVLSGGRDGGYRGFTYKSNATPGEWRVLVQTETHQTIAVSQFTVSLQKASRQKRLVKVRY